MSTHGHTPTRSKQVPGSGHGRKKRCAIYTRKSSDEGLEQDFNSLDAQRESCEAYILSQAGEGWSGSPGRYDDGGVSGATLNRPGLKRLLADIETGRIDVVVVYKVDRLTRALSDFARLVDIFDAHEVSFVSVTQAFNTTSSMGRLTLNVLLSFAQFEREVTAERIRDKIAASKANGLWMGGLSPLGYDSLDKKLVINEREAATVRRLFSLYLEKKNARLVKEEADRLGLRTKPRRPNNGRPSGNLPFTRGHLYALLANPLYAGLIAHKGHIYEGQHDPIIDREIWDEVQAHLAVARIKRKVARNTKAHHPFAGRLFDETGDVLRPHHTSKKGQRYRYYVSSRLMREPGKPDPTAWRLPVKALDRAVVRILTNWLQDHRKLEAILLAQDAPIAERTGLMTTVQRIADEVTGEDGPARIAKFIERIDLTAARMRITLEPQPLREALNLPKIASAAQKSAAGDLVIDAPIMLKRRGVEARLVVGGDDASSGEADASLIDAVAFARLCFTELLKGEASSVRDLSQRHKVDASHVTRCLPLAFLAPDIVAAILEGRSNPTLTLSRIKRLTLPASWAAQRAHLGIA